MQVFYTTEAVFQRCSVEKVFLEISQNSQENTFARFSFSIKLQAETLSQVFFCEFCEISESTFFHRTPLVAASNTRLNTMESTIKLITSDQVSGYIMKAKDSVIENHKEDNLKVQN